MKLTNLSMTKTQYSTPENFKSKLNKKSKKKENKFGMIYCGQNNNNKIL